MPEGALQLIALFAKIWLSSGSVGEDRTQRCQERVAQQ